LAGYRGVHLFDAHGLSAGSMQEALDLSDIAYRGPNDDAVLGFEDEVEAIPNADLQCLPDRPGNGDLSLARDRGAGH
jgi:hypothetical protein